MAEGHISPEIAVYSTRGAFCNFYDALDINKIKVEVAEYDPSTREQTARAVAWLDVDQVMLLIYAFKENRFDQLVGTFKDFGGSELDDGSLQSRILVIRRDLGDKGQFAEHPIRLSIGNGPGKRTSTGGVVPDKDRKSEFIWANCRFPEADWLQLLLAVENYIVAWEVSTFGQRREHSTEALKAKLESRSQPGLTETSVSSVEPEVPTDEEVAKARGVVLFFVPGNKTHLRGKTLGEILDRGEKGRNLIAWLASDRFTPWSDRARELKRAAQVLMRAARAAA